MKRFVFGLVLILALVSGGFLASCGIFERATGVQTDPVTGEKTSDGTGGPVGNILGIIFPGAAAVIAAIAAAYANAKRRDWKAAFLSTAEAVEAFKNTAAGRQVWDALKEKLGEKQAAAEIQAFVNEKLREENITTPATA
jgi:hypothetical protein